MCGSFPWLAFVFVRAGPAPERPCFARIAAAGARGRGRVSAPARFAHLIARARRRTHLARPFPPGCFSRPPAVAFCRNAERRPRKPPLSLLSFYTMSGKVKPLWEHKMKSSDIFHEMPMETRPGALFITPDPDPGSMSSSRTRSGTLTRAAAAAGEERDRLLKLLPGPRLGPGSGPISANLSWIEPLVELRFSSSWRFGKVA